MIMMGWDDQIRDLITVDQVHVLAVNGVTMKRTGWDDQMRDLKTN